MSFTAIILWIIAGFFIALWLYVKYLWVKRKLSLLKLGFETMQKGRKSGDKQVREIGWMIIKTALWETKEKK